MFTRGDCRWESEVYSVVVFPLPVGPTTKIKPEVCASIPRYDASSRGKNPRFSRSASCAPGSNTRATTFSPNTVGIVETRSSISSSWKLVLKRPS